MHSSYGLTRTLPVELLQSRMSVLSEAVRGSSVFRRVHHIGAAFGTSATGDCLELGPEHERLEIGCQFVISVDGASINIAGALLTNRSPRSPTTIKL